MYGTVVQRGGALRFASVQHHARVRAPATSALVTLVVGGGAVDVARGPVPLVRRHGPEPCRREASDTLAARRNCLWLRKHQVGVILL